MSCLENSQRMVSCGPRFTCCATIRYHNENVKSKTALIWSDIMHMTSALVTAGDFVLPAQNK